MLYPPTDEIAASCTLTAWDGDTTLCRWCLTPLVGRQTTWCSTECGERFGANHRLTEARFAAATRDGWSCQLCWRGPALRALLRLLAPGPITDEVWSLIWEAGSITPEVDHVVPVWGERGNGCQHHLENLRVLCRPCHIAETRRWAAIRRAFKREFGVDLANPETEPLTVAA